MSEPRKHGHVDYIELPAKSIAELKRTKAFYAELFGWSYRDWGDDYADTRDSGLGSGVNADASHRPHQPLVVVYVDDLEAARQRAITAGARISRDIFSFPGGRRFHFVDPAGNELAAWSDN
jgi:predicted enzyme related to lactoylglutathione lyase